MKLIRSLVIACAFIPVAASAADMPVKSRQAAPPIPLFYGGSGFYYGMETGASRTKLGDAAGANVYSAGGFVTATAGWTKAIGPEKWIAIETSVNMSNEDASAVAANGAAVNVKRRYSVDVAGLLGAPASVLSSVFANADTAFGALPASPCGGTVACIASNVHPFVMVGAHYGQTTTDVVAAPGIAALEEKRNKLRAYAGVGALVQVTNSTVWRTTATWTFGSQDRGAGFLFVPGAQLNEGGTLTAKTGLLYAF